MSTPRAPRLRLRRRLIWGSVVPALVQGRELLEQGLNRTIDGVTTLARVDSVAVSGIFVTQSGLLVRVGAAGAARVVIRPSP